MRAVLASVNVSPAQGVYTFGDCKEFEERSVHSGSLAGLGDLALCVCDSRIRRG